MHSKRWLAPILLCLFVFTACPGFDSVLTIIDLAIQAAASIETAVGVLSPSDAAVLTKIVNDATAGLNTVQADYEAFEQSCQAGCQGNLLTEAQEAAQTAQATLNNDLATLHISDPATVQKVTAWVNLVVDAFDAVLKLVPQAAAPNAEVMTATKLGYSFSVPYRAKSAKELKQQWNDQVCKDDKKCRDLIKIRKAKKGTHAH